LLSVQDVVVAVLFGTKLEACQVGARIRLAVPLAPDLFAGEDFRQKALLLLVGSELDDQRSDHGQAERRERRRVRARQLLAENVALFDDPAAATDFLRPVRRSPSLLVKNPVPAQRVFVLVVAAVLGLVPQLERHGFGDETPDFVAKRDLLWREGHVHGKATSGDSARISCKPGRAATGP